MNTLELTTNLLTKKYNNVKDLLIDIANDDQHPIFIFSIDFAKEILSKNNNWNWLAEKVYDLNSLVITNLQDYIKNYYLNVLFVTKQNKLTYFLNINDVKNAIKWLMERYVNILKNLFDKKSSKQIDNPNFFYFNSFENGEELISSSLYPNHQNYLF
jgi:hypothetical protein